MTKLTPILLALLPLLAISAGGPPALPVTTQKHPVTLTSPKVAAATGKAVVTVVGPKLAPPPAVSLSWVLTNAQILAGVQLTSGHASGYPFQTNRVPVTNQATITVPGQPRPLVFTAEAVGTNGLVSDPSNEVYYRVQTNGTIWNDTNGFQHFSFVAGSNQNITVQTSLTPRFSNPLTIYTNFFMTNSMVDLIRPKQVQEYFKLLRR